MSAETLRKAATILRERAAESEPGPWDGELDGYSSSVWREETDGQPIPIARRASERDATYIATMHPGVGLALADWLDLSARRMDEGLGYPGDYEKPLAVARLILSGAS